MLVLDADMTRTLPDRFAERGVRGGAICDGLIGITAAHHEAVLATRNGKAAATYRACGAEFTLIGD